MRVLTCLLLTGLLVSGAAAQEATPPAEPAVFFDDFTYDATDADAFTDNGWIVRSVEGWPGVPGATWSTEDVIIVDDPDDETNRLVQMTSSTNGTPENTFQTQLCQQRKFLEGTYAARVRFSDAPTTGPDGDQIVQTFYTISPLAYDLAPDYSELDFEYLPNGGWGIPNNVFFVTTWETFRPEPNWLADNTSASSAESYEGWHTLVMQVTATSVKYYVDGELMAFHTGKYVPEVPMSINFNQWFINGGLLASDTPREYVEQIDWVFHAAETRLHPVDVDAAILALRDAGETFVDTVPPLDPALESPCNF